MIFPFSGYHRTTVDTRWPRTSEQPKRMRLCRERRLESVQQLCAVSQRCLLGTFVFSHKEVCSAPLCSLTKKSAQHLCVVSQRSLLSTFVLSHKEVCSAPFFLLSYSLHTIRSSFTTKENTTTNNKLPRTAICYRGVDQWYRSFYQKNHSWPLKKRNLLLVEAIHLLPTSNSSISWWCAP